jgi:hypothetical protein
MDIKNLAVAAATAILTLTVGMGPINAAPLDPAPPCENCQPDPAGPPPAPPHLKSLGCWPYGRQGPGSARGGGVPLYPPPCPPGTPH